MKPITLPTKTRLFTGFFVLALIILITSLLLSHKQKPANIDVQPIPTPFPQVTTSIPSPNQFIWQIDHLKLPSQVELVSTSPNTQGKAILENLSQKLGFNGKPSVLPNSPIIFYSNPKESADIYLNTDEGSIKYSLNLLTRPIPQNTQSPPITELLPQTPITKASVRYQALNKPRFINTTKDKATLITTTYNYQYNNLPVLFLKGSSIEETRSLSGKLVKLIINLPPQITPTSNLVPVKTIPQIKNTPADQFTTIALSGNKKFTLSDQEIDINTAVINNGFLGYLAHQNSLRPYIFLTGTTEDPQYGPIEILIATPATSQ